MSEQKDKLDSQDRGAEETLIKSAPKKMVKSAPKKEESTTDFDSWYALRSSKIPAHHHKEILRADFSARKIGDTATVEEFDNALSKYGIKLN
jgi:hypothetical protein